MAVSWLLYTNLQNKTLCWFLCTNLENKTHYRRVTPFVWSQKSQHKFIISNSGWKPSQIINKGGRTWWKIIKKIISGGGDDSRVGTKFRLEITLFNFWIKLTQKTCFQTKKENYHRIPNIQINLDSKFSFNKPFGFLEQISKKSILPVENTKKMNITTELLIFKLV